MEQDLIKSLPPEIITNILSRLDVRAIASSKCVCKPWLDLLETDEFVKLHFSRSATALAVLTMEDNSGRFTVFELEDEIDVESSHDHHYNHPINFNFPLGMVIIEGSANGMLFLHKYKYGENAEALYVCNLITREYIELHCPKDFLDRRAFTNYGFGASKISGQYKVVNVKSRSDCHVYTLGTGSWRRVEAPSSLFLNATSASGAFVDGNLHWLVYDSNRTVLISCFDLETECFSTFVIPPVQVTMGCREVLFVLRDCLCVCDHTSENEIALWLMKDYGDDKSWTKEYVINLTPDFGRDNYNFVFPINVFKDGDVLMLWDGFDILYYSKKTKTIEETRLFDAEYPFITSMLLTPSFLSLKSFPMENVLSL